MITINLFDTSFQHLVEKSGVYSVTNNRKPRHVKYVKDIMNWSDITIFTDNFLYSGVVDKVQSKYKIGWIIEPRVIRSDTYDNIDNIIDKFDFIVTYDNQLVQKHPDKIKFVPFGGCWILDHNYGVHPKSKSCCMMYSNKQSTTGHRLRHQIAQTTPNIDLFGSGAGRSFDTKDELLKPYMFSVVIENCKVDDYFSEKLLDCLAVGTIPIYWGCSGIDRFFDMDGIITFDTLEQLHDIMKSLSKELYQSKFDAVTNNFEYVKDYDTQEDLIYKHVLYPLIIQDDHLQFETRLDADDDRNRVDGQLQPYWLNKFRQDGGNNLLYNHNLNEDSLVFDVGSFKGGFTQRISQLYNCNIYSFEPITEFYNQQMATFANNKKVKIFNCGLGNQTQQVKIGISEDNSGRYTNSDIMETCRIVDFVDFLDDFKIDQIDLLAINIEGEEYDLLERIINHNLLGKIDSLLVQFHYMNYFPHERRDKIRLELSKTFECKFNYPFVWECWHCENR